MAASRGRTPLHAAAAHGTPVQLAELLAAQGDNPAGAANAQDTNGFTPLMLAAKALNVEACLALLQVEGIDVNLCDRDGKSALHHVCAARPSSANDLAPYTEVLESLFDAGAEAVADHKGWMPLHVACDAGNYTAVSAILLAAPDGVSIGTPLGWRPLHFAAKSNRAELIPMLLRRGADVSCVCTLDGSPAAPQMTALEVAKHFKSSQCVEVLEKSAQRGSNATSTSPNGAAANSGVASHDEKPALPAGASGRAIRRTQGASDVKRAPTVANNSEPAPANKLTAGYDVLPNQPLNMRPSGPGYQGLPPGGEKKSDLHSRPAAALPPGVSPRSAAAAVEVQSEYDAVPKELRANSTSTSSTANVHSQRSDSSGSSSAAAAAAAAAAVDGGNEYDSVPTELHAIKALKEQHGRPMRKSVELPPGEYAKAPPPREAPSGEYGKAPAIKPQYQSADIHPATGTFTTMPIASGEYQKAPVPVGFERYASIPSERPSEDSDNQYDSIPTELVPAANPPKGPMGYATPPSPAVRGSPARNAGPPPSGGVGGGNHIAPPKPNKALPTQASTSALAPPPLGNNSTQNSMPQLSSSDPAASRDFKVALSTTRIGRHFKSSWSRVDAENFLRGKPANTFVLRPTTQKDGLITLSFVHPLNGTVQHSLIFDRDGGFTFGEEFGCPPAKSLLGLLQWQKLDV